MSIWCVTKGWVYLQSNLIGHMTGREIIEILKRADTSPCYVDDPTIPIFHNGLWPREAEPRKAGQNETS